MSDSDFIREVDEELRDEQIKNLWDKFGPYVIGFALLIVIGTAASKGWDYWREQQATKSGDAFIAAIDKANADNETDALIALEDLKINGTGGYPLLAEMRIAAETAKSGNVDEAIKRFDAVATDPDVQPAIQDLARIRANSLMLDQGKADEVILQLTPLMDSNSFRHSARELVLLAHLEKAEYDKAMPIAERVVADAETPSQLRQRAEVYVSYIRSRVGESASKE